MDFLERINKIFEYTPNIKYGEIFDKYGNLLLVLNAETTQEIKDKVIDFFENWDKGTYKLELRTDKTATKKMFHTLNNGFNQVQGVETINAPRISDEEIEQKITQGVNAILQKQREEEDREEFKRAKAELETTAGKFAIIIEQILGRFMAGKTNGMPLVVQGATEITTEHDTEIRKQCFQILNENIDTDTLVKIANKVKADPSVLNLLKNFL